MHEGVGTYLLLVDPSTHVVLWANENVERAYREREGGSPVGRHVEEVVYLGAEVGVIEHLDRVAQSGESSHITVRGFSLSGAGTLTIGSFYRLPSGEVLIASEWVPAAQD